ncbi:peroxiredoxin-like family protein [Crateriforma conspicua]|uniref:thioredoxin-dependent peroxiredoxin n=1 Tax=Crateriforma conspicua TaxID=2527996 RepID=A0A5C5Y224_9PLAN|nr:peroxiredoxin-like family protein [Crateriforma conspicua]QDV62327.1 Putative peroxiredoxin bcp [Crateriforma conspicua]TWT68703.1 putative peroxiredoxin bcp [Crateriforma conspicua]
MTSLREQTDARIAQTQKNNPEFAQKIDQLLSSAEAFQSGANALDLGGKAPDFTLPKPTGETVTLSDLLARGSVVVTFYRGSWCPYCNLQLRAMQQRLDDIHQQGAELVAISPEIPDESLSPDEQATLEFPVLSDQDARVASDYGVAWEVPQLILDHMRNDRKLELADINGGNGSVLPIPATFVLNPDGIVTWRFVDVDYRHRAEPDDIIAALTKLDVSAKA